ncbi:carbon monoxide dehydrogenase [Pigmentiphaga litoralis]|jgi:carbon monoxide dehydrogenase subunit G|uniref:CoxG family protein n=1 Tax=Pigmentiphaga litoralis TaxID=516702 RepID=UPI00167220E0|nr:carbon monoxide dehydrogenase subunit G [Pigmentiphaga litoralis]GGX07169.1 carbon monoxide dehydrogenase [Pigmentiphaga litoralis]
MEFKGSHRIPAARTQVWAGLNDPAVLQACVPGCEAFEPTGPDTYAAVVVAAIGPVKARFKGRLAIADKVEDTGYTIIGQGDGGMAGFGKMTATVTLTDTDEGCELVYVAVAEVGGKLAQIGSRLIGSVTNKLADEFFKRFSAAMTERVGQA